MNEVTIQTSNKSVLTIPQRLGTQLGVRPGDRVRVRVRNGALYIRKPSIRKSPNGAPRKTRQKRTTSFLDLAGIIKSSSKELIDVDALMSHHGYEQFENPDRESS